MGKYKFAPEEADGQKDSEDQQEKKYNVNVLFVDTNQELLKQFENFFFNAFLVTTANDLSTALTAVDSGRIDAVVAELSHHRHNDIFLPLLSHLQKGKPNIPVIIHSSLTSDFIAEQTLYHHAYVEKWADSGYDLKEKLLELLHII